MDDICTLIFESMTSRTMGLCNRQPGAGVVEGLATFCYRSERDCFFGLPILLFAYSVFAYRLSVCVCVCAHMHMHMCVYAQVH